MADEQRLAILAQAIRDGLFGRIQPGGPGAERDAAMNAMSEYLIENGYAVSRLTMAEQQKHDLGASIARNIQMLSRTSEDYGPTIEVAVAHRRNTAEIRDALRWVAAFSTAAIFVVGQLVRQPATGHLIAFSEARGLVLSAAAFLASIVGAGLFLLRVDLAVAAWLRLLVARVALDTGAFRSAVRAYTEAQSALAKDDIAGVEATSATAAAAVDDAHRRGALEVTPAFGKTEKASLALCVGGFALGILALVGDYVMKMPLE